MSYGDVVTARTPLAGHPLLPAWMFWSQLDTARRHAEVDGAGALPARRVPHGLPLRVGAALPAYAVEPRSWAVQDPAQRDLRDRGLAHLRRAGAGQPALIGAALGLRD